VITWTAVALLAVVSIADYARERSTNVRARVIADSVALAAVLDPENAEIVAQANDATIREMTQSADMHGNTCVAVQVGAVSHRACAEMLTPTLDD
jgi:hypothetical protein